MRFGIHNLNYIAEGRRKFGNEQCTGCNGCNGCNGCQEEGRRKKEEEVIARVSAIKNVLTVLAVAIFDKSAGKFRLD
ncbi:hypothetical protein Q5692_28745 [Microcoleus sp. C2C3]|uniref:hypothetical protein n=1 Tax=unclassified Microcoleus TaxID=2642155 RepID=UPI002FD5E203